MSLQEKLEEIWDNCRAKKHCKMAELCWRCECKSRKLKNEAGLRPCPNLIVMEGLV